MANLLQKNLCNFLGLIFHNQMLEFQQFCQAFSMSTTLHKLLQHVQGHLFAIFVCSYFIDNFTSSR